MYNAAHVCAVETVPMLAKAVSLAAMVATVLPVATNSNTMLVTALATALDASVVSFLAALVATMQVLTTVPVLVLTATVVLLAKVLTAASASDTVVVLATVPVLVTACCWRLHRLRCWPQPRSQLLCRCWLRCKCMQT